jgi:hypothetical protein
VLNRCPIRSTNPTYEYSKNLQLTELSGQETTMAIDLSQKDSIDRAQPPVNTDTAMAADDATTHATGGSGKNRPDLQELCINWCFEDASDKTAANKNLAEVLLTHDP